MKRRILLLLAGTGLTMCLCAQKSSRLTAYAITGVQKGQNNWTEVRMIDLGTGEEIKTIYKSAQESEILNARTGKPVMKRNLENTATLLNQAGIAPVQSLKKEGSNNIIVIKNNIKAPVAYNQPFATNSAACAYDKKHERLYYTPMGINELRYIDLRSDVPRIYFFENEAFGALSSPRDVANQITRMVIASNGDGYALTNNGSHLIQFTTGKKPVITDLGALSDDAANAVSVHHQAGYGGDMIADNQKNLYLITANRNVFKISLDSRVAVYLGAITGLPKGYTTNGAVVGSGSTIIVSSSNSTDGYYKFDLLTLQAEKFSGQGSVFNASDLANSNLAFAKEKKRKEKKHPQYLPQENEWQPDRAETTQRQIQNNIAQANQFAVYPNPVTEGSVKLYFVNQPLGRYQVQFMDISGKIISTQELNITNKIQVEEFRLPAMIAKGNYLVKAVGGKNKVSLINQLVVQ